MKTVLIIAAGVVGAALVGALVWWWARRNRITLQSPIVRRLQSSGAVGATSGFGSVGGLLDVREGTVSEAA